MWKVVPLRVTVLTVNFDHLLSGAWQLDMLHVRLLTHVGLFTLRTIQLLDLILIREHSFSLCYWSNDEIYVGYIDLHMILFVVP